MKKTLLTIGLALVASVTAHASLHDTYEQSCSRYGSKGYIYNDLIMWDWGNQIVVESFIDNECVMVRYCPSKGFDHTYATCWGGVQANCGGSQTWTSPHAPVEDGLPNSKSQSKDSGIKM